MNIRSRWFLAVCFVLLTVAAACGRKTSPLVPDSPRPEMIKDIKVTTRDNTVFLSWPLPARNVEGRFLASGELGQFRVYRAEIRRDKKNARYKLIAEFDMRDPAPAEIRNNTVFWADQNLKYGQIYGYRVRATSLRGGISPLSEEVLIAPLQSLSVPKGLSVKMEHNSSIVLSWEPVTTRTDGSPYEGFIGYNIYRGAEKGRFDVVPLNKEPHRTNQFKDTAVASGRTYYYIVRAVDSPALPWKESLDSEVVSATPKDLTPPDNPTGLTVVPGVGRAFLTWNENRERDLAGYHVYRSIKSGKDFERLTDSVLTRTTYSDETAKPGAGYYYRVTALDQSGNESAESVEVKVSVEKLP